MFSWAVAVSPSVLLAMPPTPDANVEKAVQMVSLPPPSTTAPLLLTALLFYRLVMAWMPVKLGR